MKIPTSLPFRVAVLAALAGSAAMLAGHVVFTSVMRPAQDRAREQHALELARILAGGLEPAVDFDDMAAAHRHLAELRFSGEASYAVLVGPDGAELAAWRRAAPEPVPALGARLAAVIGESVHARLPMETRGGRRAELRVGLHLAQALEQERQALLQAATVSALLVLVVMVGAAFAGTRLVRPVYRLAAVAQRISRGDHSARQDLDVAQSGEAGVLAAAIDRMLGALYEQRALVEALNAELEARVDARTRELEETNRQLARSLSQLERAQESLVVADRQRSAGVLAAGVAHEVNNPLAFINTNVKWVCDELQRPEAERAPVGELLEALRDAAQGCERVGYIVRSLRTYARADDDPLHATDPRVPLEAALRMAMSQLKYRARVVTLLNPTPVVVGSDVRLSQVFLNLLLNAGQAIAPGAPERNEVKVLSGALADGRAFVSVSDTGSGMPVEVRNRLFTPFFTTKPVGEGTGLGLSICHGIVSRLGGELQVESEVGRGSTFTVILPPSRDAAEAPPPPEPAAPAPAAPDRHVLVVDDDVLVAKSLKRALGGDQAVDVALSAAEALRALEAGRRYDVILCDLMMPEMSGVELHRAVAARYPEQSRRMLFVTGGAFGAEAEEFVRAHEDRVLRKPIDAAVLRERIRGCAQGGPA